MVVAAKVRIRDWPFIVYLYVYLRSGLSFHVTGYHSWHVVPHFHGVPRCNNLERKSGMVCFTKLLLLSTLAPEVGRYWKRLTIHCIAPD